MNKNPVSGHYKDIMGWRGRKKVALIEKMNQRWGDLSLG